MTVVFVSNYYNHHQSEMCRAFDMQTEHNFWFIETEPMETERVNMGWSNHGRPGYVMQSYADGATYDAATRLIESADVVIWGSCPFKMIRPRLKAGKLTFAYSERIFKSGKRIGTLLRAVKYYLRLKPYQANHYLLCSSGYAATDYNQIGLFRDAAFPWGYFPPTCHYEDISALIDRKKPSSIVWVGRFIDWKHPEHVIEAARRLQEKNYEFQVQMVGSGERWNAVEKMIRDYGLQERVQLVGAVPAEQVRGYMDAASIFLFTSDRNEGWGAVLNESMNSGCAVIASDAIGSVPFLLEDGENGLCYESGNVDALYNQIKRLLEQPQLRRSLGRKAYETVTDLWCAEVAASRFLKLAESLMHERKQHWLYEDGPCKIDKARK